MYYDDYKTDAWPTSLVSVIWPDIKNTKLIDQWQWLGRAGPVLAGAGGVLDDLDIGKDRRPHTTGPASLRLYLPLTELVGSTKGAIRS